MDRWARIVDHLLSEVIGDGDISDLPGAGKRLPLNEDCHTPQDQRAAFKIMQDNEVVPGWMALAKSVEQSEAGIRAEIESRAKEWAAALAAGRSASAGQAHRKRSTYVNQLEERIERHNRDVILHNLKAPRGIPHRSMLNSDQLIKQALAKAKREA